MLKYLKAAFINRWNLLALAGGLGLGVLSGQPDIILPLVLAGETAYLGFVGTNPKFQKYIDIQASRDEHQGRTRHSEHALQRILQSLPPHLLDRFRILRSRCAELRGIAADLKHPNLQDHGAPLERLQVEGLDRLLWVFLRLLFTQHCLERFLEQTSLARMTEEREKVESRIAALPEQDETHHARKVRRALADHLQTLDSRITNYERARSNFEYVQLELDRLEAKIKSLAELAINRQEHDFISSQIDQVAASMVETEKTMNDLQFVTGLENLHDDVPELLQPTAKVLQ